MDTQSLTTLCESVIAASEKANQALHEACASGHVRMSIPVNVERDHDILISRQLERADALARAVQLMVPMLAQLRSMHDNHACERPDGPCYTCGKLAEFDSALSGVLDDEGGA